jgi:hypothetical protein
MDYLHIRVTLRKAGSGESMRRQKVGQPANSGTAAKAALHASVTNSGVQVADWRVVLL